NRRYEVQKVILPEHGPNMAFRSSCYEDGNVSISGHFQKFLKMDSDSITNDGQHGLFLYSFSTER
ncbi:MAG: hypothetical protein KDD06_28700, partial [Phaeodactylibacter sp.]|nr:hypothetical protein [Phaeodactylibacter sp.]